MRKRWTDERLAEALPALLDEAGMSSRALGRAINIDQAHISRVMNGLMPASRELAARVAKHFGLPIDHFPDYREAAAIEAIRDDPALRDRVYRNLKRGGRGAKRR